MILVRKAKQYPGASARHHPRPSRSAPPLNNWLDEAPHPICCCVLLCWNKGIGKLRSCWHLRIIHQPYLALTDIVVHERECNPILPLTFDNIRPAANRHHVSLAAHFCISRTALRGSILPATGRSPVFLSRMYLTSIPFVLFPSSHSLSEKGATRYGRW